MSGAAKAIVELEDVTVEFPGGVRALDRISVKISEGELVGLIGPNGAGKSTLLGVILGLIKPNRGVVRIFEGPPSPRNLKQVGYVPQRAQPSDPNFPATVLEAVLFGRVARAGLFKRLDGEDRRKADEVLRLLGIESLRDRRIGQLSGGQAQRVFLAKALAGEPRLLLLDEPTSGIDVKAKAELYDLLDKLHRELGITIVLSSHDLGAVAKLADRIAMLNGSLAYWGAPAGLAIGSVPWELTEHHSG